MMEAVWRESNRPVVLYLNIVGGKSRKSYTTDTSLYFSTVKDYFIDYHRHENLYKHTIIPLSLLKEVHIFDTQ